MPVRLLAIWSKSAHGVQHGGMAQEPRDLANHGIVTA
jgi:hypothetical protein